MRSFSQIYVMAVFGVKYRDGVIHPLWRQELYAVMGKILKDLDGVVPIAIGGIEDHVHVLFSTKGNVAEMEIIRRLKTESSLWINNNHKTRCHFAWQGGGSRISYSYSALPDVKRYISQQSEHHKNMTFKEEYERWLRLMGVDYTQFDLPEDLA